MADNFNIAAGFFRSSGVHAHRLFYSDSGRNVTYGEMGADTGLTAGSPAGFALSFTEELPL